MADYFIDQRAAGANNGAVGAAPAGTTDIAIINDAWQSIADVTGLSGGDTITFVRDSGIYREPLDIPPVNGLTWYGNARIGDSLSPKISGALSLNSLAGAQWVASAGGTNEYYFTISGGDPSLVEVKAATVNQYYRIESAEPERKRQPPGAIVDDQCWGWGDNDSLGYDTFYIRDDSGAPESLNIEAAQIEYIVRSIFRDQTFNNVWFEYGNFACARPEHSAGFFWEFNECIFAYPDFIGMYYDGESGEVRMNKCVGIWCGHRFVSVDGTGNTPTVTVDGGWERGAHLSVRVSPNVGAGTVTFRNFICDNNEAGFADIRNVTTTFITENNLYFPRMTAPGGALAYNNSSAFWPTTGALDFPASISTTESNQANLIDPLFKTSTEGFLQVTDHQLSDDSPVYGLGIGYTQSANGNTAGASQSAVTEFMVNAAGEVDSLTLNDLTTPVNSRTYDFDSPGAAQNGATIQQYKGSMFGIDDVYDIAAYNGRDLLGSAGDFVGTSGSVSNATGQVATGWVGTNGSGATVVFSKGILNGETSQIITVTGIAASVSDIRIRESIGVAIAATDIIEGWVTWRISASDGISPPEGLNGAAYALFYNSIRFFSVNYVGGQGPVGPAGPFGGIARILPRTADSAQTALTVDVTARPILGPVNFRIEVARARAFMTSP